MDTGSDECLGFLWNSSSHFPGLCRLVLTCSHDSVFLRYPAIGIVWRGPVFLALGFLRHLALRGSAWWSPVPGWCSLQSSSRTCLRIHRPVVSNDEELGVRQVPSPPSHTGTSVSALRPCNPLAQSLHSCLRFHWTVVPMDDVRCGLRLFLSSCRDPSGRWKPLHVAYPFFPGCVHHWIA